MSFNIIIRKLLTWALLISYYVNDNMINTPPLIFLGHLYTYQ